MRKRRLILLNLILIISLLTGLAGCGDKGGNYVVTTAFHKNELMRINTSSCYLPEMMLYLTTVQNRYEEVYGSGIWEMTPEGDSLEQEIKDMVLAKVAQVMVMNLMAEDMGVAPSEEKLEEIRREAAAFYASLNDRERELMGVTEADVEVAYERYATAELLYSYLIRDINPEISDDEARTITVMHIFIKTYNEDADGKRTRYSERGVAEALEKAKTVKAEADASPDSFEALALSYSDNAEVTYSFRRGETAGAIENVVFNLSNGEVSDIVTTDTGYHIFKCVNIFNVEETQKNKSVILQERKEQAFALKYEAYLSTVTKILNNKLYDSITLIHDENVKTTGFFDVDF